ncbi:MAG: universal stress protein family [Sphaerisporangium sp.]|nr:universal stress protein family [Sphaerisporangium sp.]
MHDLSSEHPSPCIIVGVDGSECSKTALRWAISQAQLTGATVEAVAAWQDPAMYGYSYGWAPMQFAEGDSMQAITEKTLAETAAEVAGPEGQAAKIRTRVVQGHPAQVLMDAAAGAQMLVVGSRGHGTFAGILLGSISQHCVQHAPCPVTVIPQ